VTYTITEQDVKGPFLAKVPARMEEMQGLERLSYGSAQEALAEKFHMSERLLKALNAGKSFAAEDVIVVANIGPSERAAKAVRVDVDKSARLVKAFDGKGELIAVFPASIGSKEKPAPSGTYKITSIARDPHYKYNPEYAFKEVRSKEPFTINPGPNNPVGSVWIGLSARGYGIHGTPDPAKVGKTESHGCVRLTNWDAKKLAAMVSTGTAVTFSSQDRRSGSLAQSKR
jgi:lipoprotein-anchoring transpeptidase ErfK/SrfK